MAKATHQLSYHRRIAHYSFQEERDYKGQLHLQQLFPDILPWQESRHPATLPIFPEYNQFNPDNNRDDDDTLGLGFEITRDRVRLSEKSRFNRPTSRSSPLFPFLREIGYHKDSSSH